MGNFITNDQPVTVADEFSPVSIPAQTEEEKSTIAKWNAGGYMAVLNALPVSVGDAPPVPKLLQTEEERVIVAHWNAVIDNESVQALNNRHAVPNTPPPQTEEEKAIIAQWNAGNYCTGYVHNIDGLTDEAAEGLAAFVRTAQPPKDLPLVRGGRAWTYSVPGRSYIWSLLFGGKVTVYFNDGDRDRVFSGGFGGLATAFGWTWGTVNYDSRWQLNSNSSAMFVGPAGPFLTVISKRVPYPEDGARMQYNGGGLAGLGLLGGLGAFY